MREFLPEGLPLLEGVFGLLALVVLGSAGAVISRRNPVAAIAWLVVHFVATACLYLLLNSEFIAALQVLVYAGAIIVLFLFVIMLLKVDAQPRVRADSGLGRKLLVAGAGLTLVVTFGTLAVLRSVGDLPNSGIPLARQDSVEWLAEALMTRHLVAFELASLVLVAAMAGVLVYATRRRSASLPEARP